MVGTGQTFDIEYPPGLDAATIASQAVIATYRIDGIDATGLFTVSVGGQRVADVTYFYLRPVVWA